MKRICCLAIALLVLFAQSALCEGGLLSECALALIDSDEVKGALGPLDYATAQLRVQDIVLAEEDMTQCICDTTGLNEADAAGYIERLEIPAALSMSRLTVVMAGAQLSQEDADSYAEKIPKLERTLVTLSKSGDSVLENYQEYRTDYCAYLALSEGFGLSPERVAELNDEVNALWEEAFDAILELYIYGLGHDEAMRLTEDFSSASDAYLVIEYIIDTSDRIALP